MGEKDYSHRDVLDKLGIAPGQTLAFVQLDSNLDGELRERALQRAGRPPAGPSESFTLGLIRVNAATDVVRLLDGLKARMAPAGALWLLSPKRGQPGYVDQREVIAAGLAAGLVDNKSCSVSDVTSGLRLVLRKADRPRAGC